MGILNQLKIVNTVYDLAAKYDSEKNIIKDTYIKKDEMPQIEQTVKGAENVNATITEENVFEVTDRTGAKKTLDLNVTGGTSAGFGEIAATVDNSTGTPSVTVTTSGTNEAKNFTFAFTGLKGEKGEKGDTGEGVPSGGTTGQVLSKKSATDYDTQWVNPPAAGVNSINGKTGDVTLWASDVGALPDDTAIPDAVTEQTVSGWGFTKNTGTYSKPSGGIPPTDLSSDVQTSLGKADTALQSFTETDPTVPQWAKQTQKPTYTAQEVGALPNITKYGSTIDLDMDSATYVLTLALKDQDGTVLNTKTVDLPIESAVVNGRYDAINKKIVLTLQSGSTIDVPVGDLVAGLQTEITSVNMLDADLVDDTNSTHKFVTAQEKQVWNNKSDFSGSYNDLSDKPTIPTALSQLSGDATHRTVSDTEKTTWGNKQEVLVSGSNIKTINNESVLGSGNISAEKPVVIEAPVNVTDATLPITTLTCEVGKYYRIDVAVDTLAVTLPAMTDLTTVRTVVIYLTAGTTPAVTITSADSKTVVLQDGYEIKAGKTYEVSCLYNGAAWVVGALTINTGE